MPPASTAKFRRKGVGVSLSIYLDGVHGRYLCASLIGQAAAINSAARARLCPASRVRGRVAVEVAEAACTRCVNRRGMRF